MVVPKMGDGRQPKVLVELERRHEESFEELHPGHVHDAECAEIAEKRQGQPFQYGNVARVLEENLPRRAHDAKDHEVQPGRHLRPQQSAGLRHRA